MESAQNIDEEVRYTKAYSIPIKYSFCLFRPKDDPDAPPFLEL